MPEPQQLSLGVTLNDDATFENFYAPPDSSNIQVLDLLRAQARGQGEHFVFLWGAKGAGLSHLLQASCHAAQYVGLRFQYLPLDEMADFEPETLFEGLDALDGLCLDNLESVAGRVEWENGLFHLYNRLRDQGRCLLVAASQTPRHLPLQLPDLRSRLQWGITCQVRGLDDVGKRYALRHRARARGLELSDDVAHYLLQRVNRDMIGLFGCLQTLDRASLREQRKLTIPFIKKVLNL